MMEGEGLGLGLVLAIWRFFVVGWFACLLAWCGIRKQGSFCWIAFAFAFAFALLCRWCCWESLWFKREKGGEC